MCACVLSRFSCVWCFVTPRTVAHQTLLSMEFFRKEYWMSCHSLLYGIFLTQGLNPSLFCLLPWQVGSLPLALPGKPMKSNQIQFQFSCSGESDSLWPYRPWTTRLFCPQDSPVKNTGVDCHALLLGIFPTEGLNPASLMSSALASGFFTISTTSSYYLMIISAVIQQW